MSEKHTDGRDSKQTYQENGYPIFLKSVCAVCGEDIWTDEGYIPLMNGSIIHASGECAIVNKDGLPEKLIKINLIWVSPSFYKSAIAAESLEPLTKIFPQGIGIVGVAKTNQILEIRDTTQEEFEEYANSRFGNYRDYDIWDKKTTGIFNKPN